MGNATEFMQQLSMYGTQVEQWKSDHEEVKACWALEDAIQKGLFILKKIHARTEGQSRICVEDAAIQCDLYRLWHHESIPLLSAIGTMEGQGLVIDGADALRSQVQSIALCISQLERISAGARSLVQGNGVPAAEAIRELRRNRSA